MINNTPLQNYFNDPSVVQQIARATYELSLVEKLAWQDVLRRHLPHKRGAKILEIGTQAGKFATLMGEMEHQVIGVDTTPALLEVARQHSADTLVAATFLESAWDDLPFSAESFDVVFASEILSRCSDPSRAVRAWLNLLRAGGKLILLENDWYGSGLPSPYPFRRAQTFRASLQHLTKSYLDWLPTTPFAQAREVEYASFLTLYDGQKVKVTPLAGQLARPCRWLGSNYQVGYHLISAEKAGQSVIPLHRPILSTPTTDN